MVMIYLLPRMDVPGIGTFRTGYARPFAQEIEA